MGDWGVFVTPFYNGEIDEAMSAPGGTYITAFCHSCRKRVRHKIWMKPLNRWIYLRMAYCLLCHRSWRYSGKRLSQRRNIL